MRLTSDLSNIGVLLTFTDDDPDQCFKVLCAALLLAESLDNFNEALHIAARPEMKFRFGAHVTTPSSDASPDASSDAVQDTVVLSAVAPEGSIAASHDAFERLSRPERFIVEEQTNPILRTLDHGGARQLRDRIGSCGRVWRRARSSGRAACASQEDSTSTPSTL